MRVKILVGVLTVLLFSSVANADMPIEAGNIVFLQVHQNPGNSSNPENQRFILSLDSSISGGNNCGTDKWTGYLDTDARKAQYSTLLALYLAGKPVQVQGTSPDNCVGGSLLIRNVYPKW